jgi:YebC/PmpR family DNA-binding regulatory protein
MSGHSHWAGIKHKKEATDQKRGQVFSKLLAAISAAAKTEQNPDFNPRLRTAVEKAKEAKVPADNILRAIKRASESEENLEELTFEAYGPGGTAILIEVVSDNKNRTVQEIKKILGSFGGKWAEAGSVRWAFDKTESGPSTELGINWTAKFPQQLNDEDKSALRSLIGQLENQDDVQKVFTNAAA